MKKNLKIGDSTITVESPDTRHCNRLLAYIEQFVVAEPLVLHHRGKVTQLVQLDKYEPKPGQVLHHVWLGDQFVGTCHAYYEKEACRLMAEHLVGLGYSHRCCVRLTARPAVPDGRPSNHFLEHLESNVDRLTTPKPTLPAYVPRRTDPRPRKDLTGHLFGRLTVLARAQPPTPTTSTSTAQVPIYWRVRCECGTEKAVRGTSLTSGQTKSCGCLRSEVAPNNTKTHGMAGTPEYNAWRGLRLAGNLPPEWADFEVFNAAVGNRPTPEHRLGRADPTKSHGPTNTIWRPRTYTVQTRRVSVRKSRV